MAAPAAVPAPVIADSVTSGRRLIAEAAAAMRALCFTLLQSLRDSDFFPAPRYTPAHGSVRVPQETVMMQGPWGVNRGAEARPTVGTSVSPASSGQPTMPRQPVLCALSHRCSLLKTKQ